MPYDRRHDEAKELFKKDPDLVFVRFKDTGFLRSDVMLNETKDECDATGYDIAEAIIDGMYDAELELILDAAHSRKRELRGVRTIRKLRTKKR